MSDLRKAAEMALEALENHTAIKHPQQVYYRDNAIEALRQALAMERFSEVNQEIEEALKQPEQEPLGEEWVPCVKLPIVVHVRNQKDGETHISTREGITPVLPEDLIMRGVAGEEYPIGRELFERTYTFNTAPPKREWKCKNCGEIND